LVSYVKKTNRTARNRTRLYEISRRSIAAELDADLIASTARRGFGGELGPLLDHGPPLIEHVGPLSELTALPPAGALHEVRGRLWHRSLLVSSGDLHQDDERRAPTPDTR